MIIWNKVTWYSKLLAAILFILLLPAWTFYMGMQYEKTREAVKQPTTQKPEVNSYAYRCGDGTEFTIVSSADKETLHIIPVSNIEIIPNVVVSSLPVGSRTRYEGGGVSLFVMGKTLRITVGERPDVIVCQPILSPAKTPLFQ